MGKVQERNQCHTQESIRCNIVSVMVVVIVVVVNNDDGCEQETQTHVVIQNTWLDSTCAGLLVYTFESLLPMRKDEINI